MSGFGPVLRARWRRDAVQLTIWIAGALLLAASAVSRLYKWDAEQALTDETDAFIARFKEWEQTE